MIELITLTERLSQAIQDRSKTVLMESFDKQIYLSCAFVQSDIVFCNILHLTDNNSSELSRRLLFSIFFETDRILITTKSKHKVTNFNELIQLLEKITAYAIEEKLLNQRTIEIQNSIEQFIAVTLND